MPSVDETLKFLAASFRREVKLELDRKELLNSTEPADFKEEVDRELTSQIAQNRKRMQASLDELMSFPPYHLRHYPYLEQFHKTAGFEQSVFIMTKFPDPRKNGGRDAELAAVIQAVRDAVKACNLAGRVASDQQYHPGLWDNVELYLLGCHRGIAIVEDKYQPELNPNVALEWGWMRGLGRSVLYLVEKDFKMERADWSGLLKETFEWANPGADIQQAVKKWLVS